MRLNYNGKYTRISRAGKQIVSTTKPTFSFTYDAIVFDEERQYFVKDGVKKLLSLTQSAELQAFVNGVTIDVAESDAVKLRYDAYELIGSTTQKVLRHLGQVSLGIPTTLTTLEYNALLLSRENAFSTLGA